MAIAKTAVKVNLPVPVKALASRRRRPYFIHSDE